MTSIFDIFKAAARQTWRVRALWPLGMLAALFGQSEVGFNGNVSQRVPSGGVSPDGLPGPLGDGRIVELFTWIADHIALWVTLALAISLVWWLVAALVGWLAQGALITMVDSLDRGVPLGARQALGRSRERVVPLVLLSILLALPLLAVLLVVLAVFVPAIVELVRSAGDPDPDVIAPRAVFGLICALPLIMLAALGGVVLQLLNKVAARSCVIEGLGARASVRRGWQLIRSNLGDTLITWLLLGVVSVVVGVVAALPAIVLVIPLVQSLVEGTWSGWASAALVTLLIYGLLVGVVLGGIFTAFASAVWTKLYRHFLLRAPARG